MAINFSGEFDTPRSPDEVFDFLSDPNKFAPLLPDFQSMSRQDPTHFTVKVRVGVGNIRGTAEIKMELAEAVKPQRAQYKGQGTAVGSQVTVTAGFDLQPNGGSTKVLWQGEAGVFGKLASMAGGMLEPLGRKNIQKLIDGLQKALSEPVGVASSDAVTAAPGESTLCETPTAEATGLNPADKETQQTPLVEAPGLGPVKAETIAEAASAPVQETNGNDTTQSNS